MKLTLDFETRSRCDIKKSGAHAYAAHPSTDITCLSVKVDNQAPKIWWDIQAPFEWNKHKEIWSLPRIEMREILIMIELADTIEAHNAQFERCIWHHILHLRNGLPDLPLKKMRCSAALAAMHALPRSLSEAAAALGLSITKDKAGWALMMKMCKPRKPTKTNPSEWLEDPQSFMALCRYCMQDCEAEYALSKELGEMPEAEVAVWQLDQLINDRGVFIDRRVCDAMVEMCERARKPLEQRIKELTNYAVSAPSEVSKIISWLKEKGVDASALDKAAVGELLEEQLDPIVREVVEIRAEYAKSSVAKYNAMQSCADVDGRARGLTLYHGASTGRWAGMRIQTQNFPRGNLKPHEVEGAIQTVLEGDDIWLREVYGLPLAVASSCLRGTIASAPGHDLIAVDYAAIEGRVLAWLAGEKHVIQAYEDGKDLYKMAAMLIYDLPYDQINKKMRNEGKPSELGLGYGGGIGAYVTMAKTYGVDLRKMKEPLLRKATSEMREKANARAIDYFKNNPEMRSELDHETAMACDIAKQLWRADRPMTARLWWALEDMAVKAVEEPGLGFSYNGIEMMVDGRFLTMRLPSGRKLFYPDPKLEPGAFDKQQVSAMGINSYTKQWERQKTYGGKLTENLVQAAARDVLVNGLFNAEKAGYNVVFHVHDEAVAEVPEGFGSVEDFERLLCEPADWMRGLPLGAEGWRGKRYRKD